MGALRLWEYGSMNCTIVVVVGDACDRTVSPWHPTVPIRIIAPNTWSALQLWTCPVTISFYLKQNSTLIEVSG
jgi:hypothetical protein